MCTNLDSLNISLIDVLKELGNIGSGNAATALATILNKKVDMAVPQVKILEFKDVTDLLGSGDTPVVGIYFQMEEDIKGSIMLVLNLQSAKNLLNMMFQQNRDNDVLNELDISALSEIGNILAASYVNSLSVLTDMTLKISVPYLSIDMAGAIMSVPAIQFGELGDKVLFVETLLAEGRNKIAGNLFLIPEMDSFNTILNKLGVPE